MVFSAAIATCFRKYVDFEGRAPRSEYWYFQLFYWLCMLGFFLLVSAAAATHVKQLVGVIFLLFALYPFAVLIPSLAVMVRRLHDTNRSAWWLLPTFLFPVPLIFVLFVFFCLRGTEDENGFGADPLGNVAAMFT